MFPHSSSIIQIFVWTAKAPRPSPAGSAVLVEMLDEAFLLTAAHVIDHHRTGYLCIPSQKGTSQFAGGMGFNNLLPGTNRRDDNFDAGFMKPLVEPAFAIPADYRPVPRRDIDLEGRATPGELCLVSGFPLSPARVKNRPDGIHASRLAFVGEAFDDDRYDKLGYDRAATILLNYDRKRSPSPTGEKAPSPRGMSGGGVFRITADASGQVILSSKLIGIMHAYHESESCFAATRIPYVLRLVHEKFPNHAHAFIDA